MILFLTVAFAILFLILLGNLVFVRGWQGTDPPMWPKVSILIPARNEAANLRRLLPSLCSQSYPDFEILVYDDRSEDETWAVLQAHPNPRLRALRGIPLPDGWTGKVHALHQAVQQARGDLYLFLDADAALKDAEALRRLVRRFSALPPRSVLTGFNHLKGGGGLLVSMVPFVLMTSLPWPLVRRVPFPSLSAMNGQMWMIKKNLYDPLEPHAQHRKAVLEDVEIGRYLKRNGVMPYMLDLHNELAVWMYEDHRAAWQGFRKNVYLLMGGHPVLYLLIQALFILMFILAPWWSFWFLGTAWLAKGWVDRWGRFPWWITLLTPVVFVLAIAMQWTSAWAHATGRVTWKGRAVGRFTPRNQR